MKVMAERYDGEIRGLKEANVLLRRDLFKVRDEIRDNAASIVAELRHVRPHRGPRGRAEESSSSSSSNNFFSEYP